MSPAPIPLVVGTAPINLTQVLKLAGVAEHGGEAKAWIASGLVRVNGAVESRKRRQMAVGDVVQIDVEPGATLLLVETTPPSPLVSDEPPPSPSSTKGSPTP